MTELEENYSNQMREEAKSIASTLIEHGHIAYFAGGCVRDQLLSRNPKDFDIATSATPEQISALFTKSDMIGAHFGVVLIKEFSNPVEVATFRTDGSYKDGRRPDSVSFSSPEEDAQRRDFTINGLFQDSQSDKIIDFVSGHHDIENKLIRAIGNAQKRFQEDALRLLRAIRFATVLEFDIEKFTFEAIKGNAYLLKQISPERIAEEFSKIIRHPNRSRGLELLVESTLIDQFMPEVRELIGCEQPPKFHPEGDVYTHTKIALNLLGDKPPLSLCLAVLLHDIAKPPTQAYDPEAERIRFNGHDKLGAEMARDILKRLRFPNKTIDDVEEMVSRHMQFMHVQDMRTAKLKRFMARDTFERELELHRVDCESSNGFTDNYDYLIEKREEFAKKPIIPKPFLTGRDLIKVGLKPGPQFKQILQDAQTEQLEGRHSNHDDALLWLKERMEGLS